MGYLYIIHAEGSNKYKIGITSRDPNQRLKELQTASPSELSIKKLYNFRDPIAMEKFIHDRLDRFKTVGEWFELDELNIATDLIDKYSAHTPQAVYVCVSPRDNQYTPEDIYSLTFWGCPHREQDFHGEITSDFAILRHVAKSHIEEVKKGTNGLDHKSKISVLFEVIESLSVENSLRARETNDLTWKLMNLDQELEDYKYGQFHKLERHSKRISEIQNKQECIHDVLKIMISFYNSGLCRWIRKLSNAFQRVKVVKEY